MMTATLQCNPCAGKGRRKSASLFSFERVTSWWRRRARFSLVLLLAGIALALPASAKSVGSWQGCKQGKVGTKNPSVELSKTLQDNEDWVESGGTRGKHATTSDLGNLAYMGLQGQFLEEIDFNGANLRCADLSQADLAGADLTESHLEGAELPGANLSGANLCGAALDGANLTLSNLHRVNFETKTNWDVASLALAQNLDLMMYTDTRHPLSSLRKDFEDSGYIDQARKITYAIRERDAYLLGILCTYPSNKDDNETRLDAYGLLPSGNAGRSVGLYQQSLQIPSGKA